MVLVSNIAVDPGAQTIILSSVVGIDPIETVTYENTTKEITFSARPSTLINFLEFFSFSDQLNIFQTAILFNFPSVNIAASKPFDKIESIEFHDIGSGNWDLNSSTISGDNIVSYEATKSTEKFLMNERTGDVSVSFPEWILFLQLFNHYSRSVRQF